MLDDFFVVRTNRVIGSSVHRVNQKTTGCSLYKPLKPFIADADLDKNLCDDVRRRRPGLN